MEYAIFLTGVLVAFGCILVLEYIEQGRGTMSYER